MFSSLSKARPMLERLAYVCYLALLVSSLGVTVLGCMAGAATGNYSAMCVALAGLALSRWLHVHGHAHWHFRAWEDSFDLRGPAGLMPRPEHEEAHAEEMAALLARMEAESDVWARGEVRREIAARLAAAPALREEFADALAAHPEL